MLKFLGSIIFATIVGLASFYGGIYYYKSSFESDFKQKILNENYYPKKDVPNIVEQLGYVQRAIKFNFPKGNYEGLNTSILHNFLLPSDMKVYQGNEAILMHDGKEKIVVKPANNNKQFTLTFMKVQDLNCYSLMFLEPTAYRNETTNNQFKYVNNNRPLSFEDTKQYCNGPTDITWLYN